MEWRTIDSAPKDGKPILVFDGNYMTTGWWHHYDKRFVLVVCGYGCVDGDLDNLTHWMPLPIPPKKNGE